MAAEPLLTAVDISFVYPGDKKPTVGKTSLELRPGIAVGLFGVNACGKTTLARCLSERLKPATGTVTVSAAATDSGDGSAGDGGGSSGSGRGSYYMTVSVFFGILGAVGAALWPKLPPPVRRESIQLVQLLGKTVGLGHLPALSVAAIAGGCALIVVSELLVLLARCLDGNGSSGGSGGVKGGAPAGMSFITSEDCPANQLPQDATLETTLIALLPAAKFPDAASKREEAIRLMETGARFFGHFWRLFYHKLCSLPRGSVWLTGNFQRYNQTTGEAEGNPREYVKTGVKLRECSGGQKHLIYVLRELGAERPILLLDELLCGLDSERQARVLAMLRERKSRTAMLFITTDLHSLSVICSSKDDQVLYMDDGVVVERGEGGGGGGEMMAMPKTAVARRYVSAFRSMLKDPTGMLGSALLTDMVKHNRAKKSSSSSS